MFTDILLLASAYLAASAIYHIHIRRLFSSFWKLPGPPRANWLFGNLGREPPQDAHRRFSKKYGDTYRSYALAGELQLTTSDLTAVNHILSKPDIFLKDQGARRSVTDVIGDGLLSSEGADHRRQRRVMSPAFGWAQAGDALPAMLEKASLLCSRITPGTVDMLAELSACTLDIIGKAGMGYDLEAMTDKPNELRDTYTKTISVAFKLDLMALLKMTIKAARMIPTERTRVLQASRATARRVASTLIAEKRATRLGKDVLSLMIDRLPDTELQDQVTTLLFAGHETTSTSLAFCLRLLALHPEIQTRLRDEVMHSDAHPDMKTLNSLTYLDRVVHESLRLESPVTHVTRQAAIDTLLPLETPVNGITALPVRAGDKINIPFSFINVKESLWGPNSMAFNPDRDPADLSHIPSAWRHLLTFGAGPRNCIGFRLAVTEMKAILFTLIRTYSFSIETEISRTWLIIQRPSVGGTPQMPLVVTRI